MRDIRAKAAAIEEAGCLPPAEAPEETTTRPAGQPVPLSRLAAVIAVAALFMGLAALPACQQVPCRHTPSPSIAPRASERTYRYYPESAVYMDTSRKLFFYHDGGKWAATTLLPPTVQVDWKHYVTIKMGTDKPYRNHQDIMRRYPPSQGGYPKKSGAGTE